MPPPVGRSGEGGPVKRVQLGVLPGERMKDTVYLGERRGTLDLHLTPDRRFKVQKPNTNVQDPAWATEGLAFVLSHPTIVWNRRHGLIDTNVHYR
jgi:hypothetical protein